MTPAWAQRREEMLSDCLVSPDVFHQMVDRLGRVRRALCAPRQLTPYCHTSGLELEGMFQRSTALPDVERQRGTQHGGKAEGEEKVLKSSFRKTCMVR